MHSRLVSIMVCLATTPILKGQELERLLSNYLGVNASAYLQPVAEVFTTGIHTGTYGDAHMDSGFFLKLSMVGMASFPGQNHQTFEGATEGRFSPSQKATVPTVVGSNAPVVVEGDGGTAYVFPGGFDLDYLPLATPQLQVGGFGTELMVRLISWDLKDNFGQIQFLGLGLRHDVSRWFIDETGIDITVYYNYHDYSIADIVDGNASIFGFQVGHGIGPLHYSISGGWQSGNMNVSYTYRGGDMPETIGFELDVEHQLHVNGTVSIDLIPFRMHIGIGKSKALVVCGGLTLNL